MPISEKMKKATSNASLVRKMFEDGIRMKKEFGVENVFDFSLGNPDVPPPPAFKEKVAEIVKRNTPGMHGYMPNTGWPKVRENVAAFMNKDQNLNNVTADDIIMSVGAAGGLNVIFKTILDAGDEVISPRPCFMEYNFYIDNHNSKLVLADSLPGFRLDVGAIEKLINKNTRAILINSPHNPTGTIYSKEELSQLAKVLERKSDEFGRPIFLIADEPYRKLAYNGQTVPSIFPLYKYAISVTSYSKDMSLPGERIGFIAVNPEMPGKEQFVPAASVATRILGFVSAPSLMQLAVSELQDESVDVNLYYKRGKMLAEPLMKMGYELEMPQGAFYLFPKSPMADDLAFIEILKEEKILGVPGSGFGQPGFFRLCYCVSEETIQNSLPAFERAYKRAKS